MNIYSCSRRGAETEADWRQTYNEVFFFLVCGMQRLIFAAVRDVGVDDFKREQRVIVERRRQ